MNSNTEVTVLVKLRNVFEKDEEENQAETGGDKQPENHESAHEAETAAPVHDPLIGDTQTASPSDADDEAVQDENVNAVESQGSEEVPEQEEAPAPEEIPEEGSSENAG